MAYVPPHRRKPADGVADPPRPRPRIYREGNGGGGSGSRKSDKWHHFAPSAANVRQESHHPPQAEDDNLVGSTFPRIFCINLDRRSDKWEQFEREARKAGLKKVERFSAVDGRGWLEQGRVSNNDICRDWDATTDAEYNRHSRAEMKVMSPSEVGCALSHVLLWRRLLELEVDDGSQTMLILEDDCVFSQHKGRSRFSRVCAKAIRKLPDDWGMLYLGFSGRGERKFLDEIDATVPSAANPPDNCSSRTFVDRMDPPVRLYRPHYGYHTHAYAITSAAARTLLEHLPIQGPIDVWLADNHWFHLPVYCAVVAGEGWRLDDGTYEGRDLVLQRRGPHTTNDIEHS